MEEGVASPSDTATKNKKLYNPLRYNMAHTITTIYLERKREIKRQGAKRGHMDPQLEIHLVHLKNTKLFLLIFPFTRVLSYLLANALVHLGGTEGIHKPIIFLALSSP